MKSPTSPNSAASVRAITVKLLAGCVLPPIVQCRHEPSNDAAILDEGGHLFSKAEAMTESQRIV